MRYVPEQSRAARRSVTEQSWLQAKQCPNNARSVTEPFHSASRSMTEPFHSPSRSVTEQSWLQVEQCPNNAVLLVQHSLYYILLFTLIPCYVLRFALIPCFVLRFKLVPCYSLQFTVIPCYVLRLTLIRCYVLRFTLIPCYCVTCYSSHSSRVTYYSSHSSRVTFCGSHSSCIPCYGSHSSSRVACYVLRFALIVRCYVCGQSWRWSYYVAAIPGAVLCCLHLTAYDPRTRLGEATVQEVDAGRQGVFRKSTTSSSGAVGATNYQCLLIFQ